LLEIGPGRGALTGELLQVTGRMAAVELDALLAGRLRERFAAAGLILFDQDVLQLEFSTVLAALGATADGRLVVAGNLPYGISKPVSQKLIRERGRVDRAVLMFQREVAERLTASPGSRSYGPLGVVAGLCYRIEKLFDVSPRAFRPMPRVTSTVTRWSAPATPAPTDDELARLRGVLRAAFAGRRKTLRNNLRVALADPARAERLLAAAAIEGELRAEALPPAAFQRLAELWDGSALL